MMLGRQNQQISTTEELNSSINEQRNESKIISTKSSSPDNTNSNNSWVVIILSFTGETYKTPPSLQKQRIS